MTAVSPDQSYAFCRRLSRRAGSSFPFAFRLLPKPQRNAMHALYAFCRVTDDLADDPATNPMTLADWRNQLSEALGGNPRHPLHPALHDAVRRFQIPAGHLFDVIAGAESDRGVVRFETFADLEPYCHKVASAVGLACLPIWGVTDQNAQAPATAAGVAFQLTNILRDLGEDRARGRIYLPQDELTCFECPVEKWRHVEHENAFCALMAFQVARARAHYRLADDLPPMIPRPGRAVFQLMAGLYERLLDEIERRKYDVFSSRVKVGKIAKGTMLVKVWLSK